MEISKKTENVTNKENEKSKNKQRKMIKKALLSSKLRIPLIALVIIFHFVACICIGLVISLYTFPLERYSNEELNKYTNISKTIIYSGINKLNYYSINISSTSDGIAIDKVYNSGIKDIDYSKISISLKMNKLLVEQEGKYIYFIPDDTRKDYDYIPRYNITTNVIDFSNTYEDIRFNYILICNSILGFICLIIIIIIYATLGVFKKF